jgi:molybdopterin-guanine dinucleotide biosynthesis protein A
MKLLAAIQAGGRSARMGTDKAWLELAGRPLIEHVLAAARPLADRLAVVISRDSSQLDKYAQLARQWRATLLYDLHDHRGPLGGIHTSLLHAQPDEKTLVLACDLPFVTTDFFNLLREVDRQETAQAAPHGLTTPVDEAGRVQMLAGIYGAACLPQVEQMLAEDVLRLDRLCARVRTRRVEFAEYAHLPGAEKFLRNLNTPEDVLDAS